MSMNHVGRDERLTAISRSTAPEHEELTAAQRELLHDMRISLKQMKRGELLPAREALREIDLEIEAEENANSSDA